MPCVSGRTGGVEGVSKSAGNALPDKIAGAGKGEKRRSTRKGTGADLVPLHSPRLTGLTKNGAFLN